MKKHKFIPVAVLAGLCAVAFGMNNQQYTAEKSSKTVCTPKKGCTTTTEEKLTKKGNGKVGKHSTRRTRTKTTSTKK